MRNLKLTPHRITAISLFVFFVLITVGVAVSFLFEQQRTAERQYNLRQVASNQAHTIQRQLDQSLSSTYALAAILKQNNGQINDFDALAAEMIEIYGGINSLQLAPNGIVNQIYPLSGNESALGFNALEVPDRRAEAVLAISSRKLTLAGPYEIIQGGFAMIGRYPVFIENAQDNYEFWGFTQALIRVSEFIEAANLNRLETNGFAYTLQKINLDTGEFLEIASSSILPDTNGVMIDFEVPNATWRLTLNYQSPPVSLSILGFGALASFLLAVLVTILTNRFLHQNLALQSTNLNLQNEIQIRKQAQQEIHLAYEKVEAANTRLAEQLDQLAASREALRQSETRYRILLHAIPDLIIGIDAQGLITDLKPDPSSLSAALAASIGQPAQAAIPESMAEPLSKATAQAKKTNAVQTFEFSASFEKGEFETFEVRVAVQDNQQIVCVIRNITNQKKIITDLIASQKLASLGSLAAGIAHEMNSPLQVIIGLSSSLQERLQAGEYNLLDTLQYLQTIHRNGWRGAEIVRSLLQYARPSIEEMSATDLNETVHETLILIENQLKTWDNIRVNLVLEPKLPKILGRKSQLSQALINLLSNARDAMPTGGEVSIRTAFEPSTQKVLLQVADSGDGIPLDKIPRIFDPFFTSKEVGQGTGLGLSIVLGIVNSHQAEIQVDSEPGRGSTFTISFPILTE